MKVRCGACGQVSNQSSEYAKCPGCGEQLNAQGLNNGKGQLPTQDASARNVGCLVMGILLFGIPLIIAGITGGGVVYWVSAIAAIIILIPLGVWFERKTIKRRQK